MNLEIFHFFNDLAGGSVAINWITIFFANWIGWLLVIGLLLYLWFAPIRSRAFWKILIIVFSAALAWFIAGLVKYSIHAPRPYEILKNINVLFRVGNDEAFPSGHATFFGAMAVAFFIQDKKWGAFYIICAALIGIARITAGVHWPDDILAGFAIGGLVSFIVWRILRYFKRTA